MNKILNINLGGYALTIDDDAYEYLSSYLESIRRRFSESEGRDEIMHDIESRLGEIISTSLGNRTIVMLPDVEAAIEVMGKPEDFGGEPVEKPGTAAGKKTFIPGKKLFRDEDDAVIGGVCSGLAAYFGIADPIWVRLIVVVLTLGSFGFAAPAYLLLWILMPPARSAAERLAMRGEKANVENIAREIEHGFERLSKRVNDFSASAAGGSAGRTTANVAGGCLRIFGKLALALVILIAGAMVLGLGSLWVVGTWAFVTAQPYISYFSPLSGSATYLGFFNAFFMVGIPVVGLILWLGRTIFRFKTPAWLGAGMGVLWALNFISFILIGGMAFGNYREGGNVTKNLDLSGIRSDTLHVQWAGQGDLNEYDDWGFGSGDIQIGDKHLKIKDLVEINVRRSLNGQFECKQTIRARGGTMEDAIENASSTNFDVGIDGNTLRVPTAFDIRSGKKWKGQRIILTISVPDNKFIVFGDVVNYRLNDVDYADPDGDYYIGQYPDKAFRMTPQGLVCSECPQFGDRQFRDGRYYEKFILEGNFNTEIIKDDEFSISYEGAPNEQSAVEYIRTGDDVTLTTRGKTLSGQLRCIIKTPVFTALIADNTGQVTIRGFEEGRSFITAKGSSSIRGFFDSREMDLTLSNKCQVELVGKGEELRANLSDGAKLEAGAWRTQRAEISASDTSYAKINAEDDIKVKSDASSTVKIEGSPRVHTVDDDKQE
ncbi:MAG: PspC domain-containing protein [Saprospiraceae bacterium]|nr:PspC domain-containing protein [Saprospiraceae bacterium]